MNALGVYRFFGSAIKSIDHLPTLFCPGKSISQRGKIKVCFDAVKECNDLLNGTELGRLVAAQKYFSGREMRVYQGDCDMTDICQFTRNDWIIEKVDGPSGDPCQVCFTAEDPLTIADGAKCPNQSDKFASADIGQERPVPTILSAALDGFPDQSAPEADPFFQVGSYILPVNYSDTYSDLQNLCIARTRYVKVGSEILGVEAEKNSGLIPGWNLKLRSRFECGSQLAPHDINAPVKLCMSFEQEHVVDVWLRLLNECAELADFTLDCCEGDTRSLINYESFEKVRCENPLYIIDKTVICDPISVLKLRQELASLFLLMEAFDQSTGQIKLFSFRPPDCDVDEFPLITSQYDLVKGSMTIKQSVESFNRVLISHDQINCAEDAKEENLGSLQGYISDDLRRSRCDRRENRSFQDKEIKSRWLNDRSSFLAETMAYRHYQLHRCPLRDVEFETSFEIAKCYDFGEFYRVQDDKLRDWKGDYIQTPFMVKGKQIAGDCMKVTLQESPFTNNIKSCLSCEGDCVTEFTPAAADPCLEECDRVW